MSGRGDGEAFYESVVEAVRVGLWVTDAEDRIILFNGHMERIAGVAAAAMLGLRVTRDFPEETTGRFLPHYRRARDTLESTAYEAEVVTPAGRPTVQAGWLTPRVRDGRFDGMICTIQDVTEQKRAQEDYQLLFRQMLDGFALHEIVCDDAGRPVDYRFLAVNPAFEEMTGLRGDAIVGRRVREVLPDVEPYWIETYGRVALTGEPAFFENDAAALGKRFQVRAFRTDPGRFVTVFVDVTAHRRAESEQAKLREQLAQTQRLESVGRLAGGVAHDFNNMLNLILGHADLALTGLEADSPLRDDLEEIARAARRSAQLTGQLLTFARRQAVTPRVQDLNAAVATVHGMLGRLVGEGVELVWRPCPGTVPVRMDGAQLDQVLTNLVLNARDAVGGSGRVAIATDEVEVPAGAGVTPGRYVRVSVSDDGHGMDEATRARVFEPFFTTKPLGEGTGLGLATVHGIAEQNGGFVEVDSAPGRGATFRVHLPVHAGGDPEPAPAAHAPAPVPAPAGRTATILLVEDEEAILALGRRMLEQRGHRVLAAGTPERALQLAAEHPGGIDLLVTDVVMPGLNGRELAERLTADHPRLRSLYVSGYTADVIEDQGVLGEGSSFLPKPFTAEQLLTAVDALLAAR